MVRHVPLHRSPKVYEDLLQPSWTRAFSIYWRRGEKSKRMWAWKVLQWVGTNDFPVVKAAC